MRRRIRAGIIGLAALSVLALNGCERWTSNMVSVDAAGTSSGNGWSMEPVVSPDGTKVAFRSRASNLGPTDTTMCTTQITRPCDDVYLRDLATGQTSLLSVNAAGTNSGNGDSLQPVFSPDGTKVAFISQAKDLTSVPAFFPYWRLYLRDLTTGTTTLVTTDGAGTGASSGNVRDVSFSADGTKLIFTTSGGDLGPTDTNNTDDVYLKDLVSGTVTLVSANAAGTNSGDSYSNSPTMTPDGTKVIFSSTARNLGPANSVLVGYQVFVRDLAQGTTSLVSHNTSGTGGSGDSFVAAVSPDGNKVAFYSKAADFGVPDQIFTSDIYVRDLVTDAIWRLPLDLPSDTGGIVYTPAFSPDSTEVAFTTWTGLTAGSPDTNGTADVYVFDLATGEYQRVSESSTQPGAANGPSNLPQWSPDGTRIVFHSAATDAAAAGVDNNGFADVLVRDLASGTTQLVSVVRDGSNTGNGESTIGPNAWHPDGDFLVYTSLASNLGTPDTNGQNDVYLAEFKEADS